MLFALSAALVLVVTACGLLFIHALRLETKLQRTQQQLAAEVKHVRAADQRFQSLFSSNPLPMWVQDSQTLSFLAVNEASIHQYGYSREEFMAMTLLEIRPTEDGPKLVSTVQSYHPGVNTPGVFRHRRKDGSLLFADVQVFRMENGGHERDLIVALDVTDRLRMENAVRESQASLQTMFDGAPFGICQTSLVSDRFMNLNPAMRNILGGYSLEQALQLNISTQVYADPKERDHLIEVLRRNRKLQGYETNFLRRDGSTVRVRISGTMGDRDGDNCETFSAYVEDLTQQSVLEQQVRQVQKLEAVGRLAGGVAHDFNNILLVIKLCTELMLRQTTPDNPLTKPLLQVANAADRAAALTKQMLAFGRQQIMQVRTIDVNAVVRDTSHMLRRIIGEDIQLVTKLAENLQNSKLDPDQLLQVILNLAVNARDAMPSGGTLEIETANVKLDETFTKEHPPVEPGQYVMIAVTDTGTGMDKSTLARIFDPFFTTKEVGKGTGLGLSIVYGIVKQSGGYIWVYSEPGYGSTFKLYFPATSAPVQHAMQLAETNGGSRGETVLVVEDESMIRSNIRGCLEQMGYRVLDAPDGGTALDICSALHGEIDLILTDLVMPGLGGHELATQLLARHPDLRFLYMSGYTEDSAQRRAILTQGSAYLQKPFSVAELSAAVHQALAGAPLKSRCSVGERSLTLSERN